MKVKRNEIKYYISWSDYQMLSRRLQQFLTPDPYNKGSGYLVRSIYFDNLFNKAFEEKVMGVKTRRKFRVRLYGSGDIKFEIKNKKNNYVDKESFRITKEQAEQLLKRNYDMLLKHKDPILYKTYAEFIKDYYHPVVMIDYIREAYTFDMNNIRITFDKHLSSSSSNLDLFSTGVCTRSVIEADQLAIMEVKYNGFLPDWIKKILQVSRFQRSAISKYCLGRMAIA